MKELKNLLIFKKTTHAVYTAYTMAGYGMQQVLKQLESTPGTSLDGVFQIGTKGDKREAYSEISTRKCF